MQLKLIAILLLVAANLLQATDLGLFNLNSEFKTAIKNEYVITVIPSRPISCETGEIIKIDKKRYKSLLDSFYLNRHQVFSNQFNISKDLELGDLLKYTRVFNGKRYFCVREKSLLNEEILKILKLDKWRTKK